MPRTNEARLSANRANARRSTGPQSAAGKQRSSQNAVKHGLSRADPVQSGEPQTAFTQLEALRAVEDHAQRHFKDLQDLIQVPIDGAFLSNEAWMKTVASILDELRRLDRYRRPKRRVWQKAWLDAGRAGAAG